MESNEQILKTKNKSNYENSPHAASVLERVGAALKRAIEVAMNLVLPISALVHQSEFKQRSHIRTFAGKRNENGYIGRIVLRILAIGVEVYSPLVAADREILTGYVLANADPFG